MSIRSHNGCDVRFSPLSRSSTRSHHRQIPAAVQLQVSFASYPRPFDLARSQRLHQCPFPFSSGADPLNSNSGSVVVNLDPHQLRSRGLATLLPGIFMRFALTSK